MILSDLKIHHLRNIKQAHLSLNSKFNFIYGPNGSGKTSVLEALYLLSCGRSFRTREISPIISNGQSILTVFAKAKDQSTISVSKSSNDTTQIKLNNQFCQTTSQLAQALPCQIFYSDLFNIIDAGPLIRRAVLDWGLFHVKHEYLSVLKEYKLVLKQRNALLKQQASYSYFVPWDNQLVSLADQIHQYRAEYFNHWYAMFNQILPILTDTICSIDYYKGWDRRSNGTALNEMLVEHFQMDKQRQYTQYGPHQADIIITNQGDKAKNVFSRGQQKIILIGLKLAQCKLLKGDCLYLFDDLNSELDELHQKRLFQYLDSIDGQYVITDIQYRDISSYQFNDKPSIFMMQEGYAKVDLI